MVDTAFVITVVGTGMGILIGMGGMMITLFMWNRSEANADRRSMVEEMKDFHSRLIAIEERRNKFIFKE